MTNMSNMSLSERYLSRLGIERPTKTDLATLHSLLEAHLRAIPFEDVTSFLGSPVSIEPEEVFAKLLEGRRGGYCMEHGLLSRTVLRELGFKTEVLLARVFFGPESDKPTPQSHSITLVHLDDGASYIFDPGFGGYTPSMPIRFGPGSGEQVGKYAKYRMRPAAETLDDTVAAPRVASDIEYVLEQQLGDNWVALYGTTRLPVVEADLEAFNWNVSTNPASFFTRKLMVAAWDGNNRVTGFARNFKKRTEGGGVTEGVINGLADVDHWLRKEMGLGLTDEQVAAVWDKLQHEAVL